MGGYEAPQDWTIAGNNGEDKEGFVGCIFKEKDNRYKVVAYAGTDFSSTADHAANAKIMLRMMPAQLDSAKKLFDTAKQGHGGPIYLVGHSLGGALAQVVGTLKLVPFVTFNAPGMKAHLLNMGKAYKSTPDLANGINYRLLNDLVPKGTGEHLGETQVLDAKGSVGGGIFDPHKMDAIVNYIAKSPGLSDLIPPPLNTQ
jgi:hypothetical protein